MPNSEILCNLEKAYFEDFSGENPLMDAVLPNAPDWNTFNPKNATYAMDLGIGILDHNLTTLQRQGLEIDPNEVPQLISGLLRLTQDETDIFLGKNDEDVATQPSSIELEEAFLVAKYLSDVLQRKFGDPDLIAQLLRKPAEVYGDVSMIEMVGEGEGALLVGMTHRSFDLSRTP